ncbi:SlyX family protein [Paracoccus spongiarum]|uniref:SlyX family protein n=1 Tax=Paracoccus spongiarum TaxID=3064387 RepID=A0ABT9J885_9RHOB|nr:SlyX family protein [Paracoccus sp. 2205BS29-5]MDP5306036.1 SlyX family protein [Paracoccus sp. 2205BS29-5]
MDKQAEPRIERLEETLAHLIRLTEDLSEVIARQDAEIVRLSRRLDLLMRAEAEREAAQQGGIPLADQRPPHW